MAITKLSPTHLDLFLRCFIADPGTPEDQNMPGEDIAVVQSDELLKYSFSNEPSSKEICMLSLKSLIFYPPAAIDPLLYNDCWAYAVCV